MNNEPKLPPLPEPVLIDRTEWRLGGTFYTAEQMQAYARAAIAAQPAVAMPELHQIVEIDHSSDMAISLRFTSCRAASSFFQQVKEARWPDAAAPAAPAQSDSASDARDAARYRWLQKGEAYTVEASTPTGKPVIYVSPRREFDYAEALDTAIDAAMAREQK